MPVKKIQAKEANGLREFGRKAVLAYVGMFGIATDKLNEWFDLFVERGEEMEKDARKMMRRNEKEVRKFAADLQKQEKAAVHKAEKTVRKAVKRAEAMV
jgi:hypothetical protein